MTAGTYVPTEVCDQGLADKLGIPGAYLCRTRLERPGLYDSNVSGWLDGDPRKFLVRCLQPAMGTGPGAARAFLSEFDCMYIDGACRCRHGETVPSEFGVLAGP
jgi:hypothetical protein